MNVGTVKGSTNDHSSESSREEVPVVRVMKSKNSGATYGEINIFRSDIDMEISFLAACV